MIDSPCKSIIECCKVWKGCDFACLSWASKRMLGCAFVSLAYEQNEQNERREIIGTELYNINDDSVRSGKVIRSVASCQWPKHSVGWSYCKRVDHGIQPWKVHCPIHHCKMHSYAMKRMLNEGLMKMWQFMYEPMYR